MPKSMPASMASWVFLGLGFGVTGLGFSQGLFKSFHGLGLMYLEGQGDLISRVITPITHIIPI